MSPDEPRERTRNRPARRVGKLRRNGWGLQPLNGPVVNGEQYHRGFPAFPLTFNSPKGEPSDATMTVAVFLPPKDGRRGS